MHAKSPQLQLTLRDPTDGILPGSSGHGISRQEYWSGLLFPTPGHIPDPVITPASLYFSTLALAGGFFPAHTTWEGFLSGASGKEPACQCRRHKRPGFCLWVGKIPWGRAWQPTPVFLPGESHGQRSLEGYGP